MVATHYSNKAASVSAESRGKGTAFCEDYQKFVTLFMTKLPKQALLDRPNFCQYPIAGAATPFKLLLGIIPSHTEVLHYRAFPDV